MTNKSEKNRRIAKNAIVLYLRSIVILLVALYTSRIVLAALGVEDYGIYYVVGGVVAVFSSISGSISGAISRFLTFEIGREDISRLKLVFSTSIQIQAALAIVIVLLVVILGGWFIEEKLNIPADRVDTARWVLVFSALSFGFGLISATYQALIIAHEKMSAYAYISIFDVLLKLTAAWLITMSTMDNLKLYAVLIFGVSLLVFMSYWLYCRLVFDESRYRPVWDTALLKNMFGFSGWAFSSHAVGMLNTQGINILTNIYFGVAFNAARGIASQVESALNQFIGNLTVAVNPQITKSYAVDDKAYMFQLICSGSKFAYFSALLFIIPLFIQAEAVLALWLGAVPEHATVFVRLILLTILPQVLGGILFTGAMATGKIRSYSVIVNGISIFTFLIAWVLFWLGYSAEVAYLVHFVVRIILVIVRVVLLKSMIGFSALIYFKSVVMRIVPVSVMAFVFPFFMFDTSSAGLFFSVLLTTVVSVSSSLLIIYFVGLTKDERSFIMKKLQQVKAKFLRVKYSE